MRGYAEYNNGVTIPEIVPARYHASLGAVRGMSYSYKFGYTLGLASTITISNSATWVDLWSQGGVRTPPSSTFTPFMASTDGGDTENISCVYQDASGVEQTVTVALTGQTPVSLGVTAGEVYRAYNVGSADLAGTVSITTVNDYTAGVPDNQNEILAEIPVNDNQTQQIVGRVPSDVRYVLESIFLGMSITGGVAGSAIVALEVRHTGEVFRNREQFTISTNAPLSTPISGVVLPSSADYRLRVRDVSNNSTDISGALSFAVIKN